MCWDIKLKYSATLLWPYSVLSLRNKRLYNLPYTLLQPGPKLGLTVNSQPPPPKKIRVFVCVLFKCGQDIIHSYKKTLLRLAKYVSKKIIHKQTPQSVSTFCGLLHVGMYKETPRRKESMPPRNFRTR